MKTATARQVIIPAVAPRSKSVRWFSALGCVAYQPDVVEVFVGNTLIATYAPRDKILRDVVLTGLAQDRQIKKGKLAQAFGIGAERLRRIRRDVDRQGLGAFRKRLQERRGRKGIVTPAVRRHLHRLFKSGSNVVEAFAERGEQAGVSYRTVCRVHQAWLARHREVPADQLALVDGDDFLAFDTAEPSPGRTVVEAPAAEAPVVEAPATEAPVVEAPVAATTPDMESGAVVDGCNPRGGRNVQHLGGWLLVATVAAIGLHQTILSRCKGGRRLLQRLRMAIDAVVLALGLGQRCVEGVRRLQTPSSGVLLRAKSVPSHSWTRRVLKQYLEQTDAFWVQLSMTQVYLERSRMGHQVAAVFYIDNHMRPYTGKHTVRKGWRMQDKRVRPGATDYYVHDEDGRPVYRFDVPSNDSLTAWLDPATSILAAGLGPQQRILVAFDRAGAFPEQMMRLRQSNIEFVTYERRPYPLLSPSAFDEQLLVHKGRTNKPEVIGVHESRQKNLRKGRGRVRRIALKMPDGHQVNLLAVSDEPKERLIEVMLGRWVQENAFKHGNERWGINQLDRREVMPYPPETIIPNPARRRLDHALRLARQREGEARRKLARLEADDPKRTKVQRDLDESLDLQKQLEAHRPNVPKHAPLNETELKGKLVYHPGQYKTLLDTIRIASANAESELAAVLQPHLRRPREAKKALANLFAAPGDVRVNGRSITVTLMPAGTPNEQRAFQRLFEVVNRLKLTLPGDTKRRPLRFRSHLS